MNIVNNVESIAMVILDAHAHAQMGFALGNVSATETSLTAQLAQLPLLPQVISKLFGQFLWHP